MQPACSPEAGETIGKTSLEAYSSNRLAELGMDEAPGHPGAEAECVDGLVEVVGLFKLAVVIKALLRNANSQQLFRAAP